MPKSLPLRTKALSVVLRLYHYPLESWFTRVPAFPTGQLLGNRMDFAPPLAKRFPVDRLS
uniref:Uncharacterized protein n=1 Tax=Utricularia reniformis TaxID=192314 RepID=A0A1Y0AZ85_9LAMI|nr:hypothetical protein AEK19_MT0168 [Utricularia reniformis]ART30450.1 hypothetical protein AEK19_MT0168 [Utricularia reniformis]